MILKTNLRKMVGRFTHQRMDEISTTESACYKGIHITPIRCPDLHILSNVRENVGVTEGNESCEYVSKACLAICRGHSPSSHQLEWAVKSSLKIIR